MTQPLRMIIVRALWDADASVWVATSDDLPGLVTEAASVEALAAKLPAFVSDLISLNGSTFEGRDIPIHIIAKHTTRVANPKAA